MTDISVNRVENGQELHAAVTYSKHDANEVDPLAVPDAVRTAVEKERDDAAGDGNAKEEAHVCGDGIDTTVLDTLDETGGNVTNPLKEDPILTNKPEIQDSNTLDTNAPTPDLPEHMLSEPENDVHNNSDTILNTDISETFTGHDNIQNSLEIPLKVDIADKIEEKLKQFESPVLPGETKTAFELETEITTVSQLEEDLTDGNDLQEYKETSEITDDIQPHKDALAEENRPKVQECKENSVKNDVKTIVEALTITAEERVKKLLESELLDKVELTEKTEIMPEKIQTEIMLTASEKSDARKSEMFVKVKALDSCIAADKSKAAQDTSESFTIPIKSNLVPEKLQTEKIIVEETTEEKLVKKIETNPKIADVPVDIQSAASDKTDISQEIIEPDVVKVKSPEKMEVDSEKNIPEKVKEEKKIELKIKKSLQPPMNGDVSKDEQPTKRRASDDIEESPLKKLCQEVEKTFPQHEHMISEYIQSTTKNNIDEIQKHTEQLLAEIQTLRELAQKKEQEWNNILHMKKVKEEILLRLLRRKQVLSFEKSVELNGSTTDRADPFDFMNPSKNLAIDKSDEISGLSLKQPGCSSGLRQSVSPINPLQNMQNALPVMSVPHFNPMSGLPPPYDKAAAAHMQNMANNIQNMQNNIQNMQNNMPNIPNNMQNMPNNMQNMPKPVYQPMMLPGPMQGFPRDINAMNGQMPSNYMPMGRQGPTKDVKSIIADYRQRNPDITPRRGRRMKSILNPNMLNAPRNVGPSPKDGINNMNNLNNMNMLFNNLDMNQKAMLERLQQMQAGGLPNSIFKDALVQFANMQQNMHQNAGMVPTSRPDSVRPDHHPKERRRPERLHEEHKQPERLPSSSPRLPPPPPYPEISLLPVSTAQDNNQSQSLLHGILTKPWIGGSGPDSRNNSDGGAPTLARLLTSPDERGPLQYGQAKNCGEITITPVQPHPEPQPEKPDEVVQVDYEDSPPASETEAVGSPASRLVIDETAPSPDAPLCQGCKRRDAQFVCAGCANQWYCSRDCQVAAWDDHSEMCSG